MTTLPAIGETVVVHGGRIVRVNEKHFAVVRVNGQHWTGHGRCSSPEVAYASILNRLRVDAGLEALPLPCAYCLEKPRIGTTPYCSRRCMDTFNGVVRRAKAQTKPKAREAYEAAVYVPMKDAIEALHRIAPDPLLKPRADQPEAVQSASRINTPLSEARKAADALIMRRWPTARIPKEGYLRPENYERDAEMAS